MASKIIIAGGTGFLGHSIIDHLKQTEETTIVVLTRGQNERRDGVTYVHWDAQSYGDWANELEGSTAIINLVGKSVNCRYTKANREEIINSRVNATLIIGKAIQQAIKPPEVWINAGSAAIFGDGGDEVKDESSPLGTGFSSEVCKKWEQAFFSVPTIHTRKVFLRIGLVFQKDIGLLQPFIKLVKTGFGGTIGSGNQYISWIHADDFVHVIDAALKNDQYEGIVHCTSPGPVTNRHFMTVLRKVLQVPFGLPNWTPFVKSGAVIIGTEAELVLRGRRVVSKKLAENNFVFRYPDIETALQHLAAG